MSYDPTEGRFIEMDPEGYIDGPNRYQVDRGNTLVFVDPKGTAVEKAQVTQPAPEPPATQPVKPRLVLIKPSQPDPGSTLVKIKAESDKIAKRWQDLKYEEYVATTSGDLPAWMYDEYEEQLQQLDDDYDANAAEYQLQEAWNQYNIWILGGQGQEFPPGPLIPQLPPGSG
jgi:hypothetical protein